VVFTSGATEANNLALAGIAAAAARRLRIAVPATEHASVLRTAEALARAGHDVRVLPAGTDGRTDPDAVTAAAPDLLAVALENAAALAAFAAALGAAGASLPEEATRLGALTARLREAIAALAPESRVAGDTAGEGIGAMRGRAAVAAHGARAPHILDVVFPDLAGESLVTALDLEGIAVSAGSACAAGA